ncbi:MAG: hypothetical protein JXR81_11555 [Candidatus Goldbacteria bacterium]|nr:hypothetical protein [Candidatus Goldiibacteriota bacterium]
MKKNGLLAILFVINLLFMVMIAGCAPRQLSRAASFEQDDEWMSMVFEYRKAAKSNPEDQELRTSLKRAEFEAAEHFYTASLVKKNSGDTEQAIALLQKGLSVMPENDKVKALLAECAAEKEARDSINDAKAMIEAGREQDAKKHLERAVLLMPEDKEALALMEKINSSTAKSVDSLFTSDKRITLKFSNTDIKTVFDFLSSAYGINTVFDDAAKNAQISVNADEVTFEQALNLIMSTGSLFYKKIGSSTILVAQDTRAKRDQYEDLLIKNFQLNSIKASEMSNILKNSLNLKRVTVNETLNTLTIRDTEDILKLCDKIIGANDRKQAEVVFDVEIMEVNRTKAEQLGLNYGSQIKLALPSAGNAGDVIGTTFLSLLKQGTLTLPSFTLNFFKQDVDAKMLANPRVRVIDGKKAKIHIGDRVPLRSSIVQDATGQVRYSYEYKDIGVMLEVTPKINFDNTVNVQLRLEVSTLGSNIGTATDPAYSIGTRDADTVMLLRDGETAILGGLIRDEERSNKLKIPGLGDIPLIGSLFTTSTDDYGARTDVLLTITPRVVRGWEVLPKEYREIYSGTENNITSKPRYFSGTDSAAAVKTASIAAGSAPVSAEVSSDIQTVNIDAMVNTLPVISVVEARADTTPAEKENLISADGILLAFEEPQYVVQKGQEAAVKITAANLKDIKEMTIKAAFDPELLSFVSAEKTGGMEITVKGNTAANGVAEITVKPDPEKKYEGRAELLTLKLKGEINGVSYLVFLESKITDINGKEINVQRSASRLVVK